MSRFLPKSIVCLREGYTARLLAGDLTAGLTVGIVALPLAMAFGIASIPEHVAAELAAIHPWLTPPAMGLFTAVVAGFLISALGGSRVQIGGPTGAFIVIVYGIADQHGYAGLATATLMAGVITAVMGFARFGAMIKFIPYPVVTGFTAGIAVIIATSQVKDFLGLTPHDLEGLPVSLPADFVPKVRTLVASIDTLNWPTLIVGAGSLAVILAFRRYLPRIPGPIVAVVLASPAVWLLKLDASSGGAVQTVGSRFGGIPGTLPRPHLPRSARN